VGEPPEHGEDAVARGERRGDGGAFHMAPRLRHAKAGDDLVGATSSHSPEVDAVPALAAAPFAEVEGDGGGGPAKLLGEFRVTLGDGGEWLAELADHLEGDIEGVERHVRLLLGGVRPLPAQVP
jgi:hypothetical protein